MIRDRNIDWSRKPVYVCARDWNDNLGVTTITNVKVGTGVAVEKEINSLLTTGVLIGAAGADATGDEFHHHMPIPYDLDPDDEVGFRVHWCSGSSTDADDVAFVMLLNTYAENGTIIAPATVLDTVIPSDLVSDGAAYAQRWTERGIKDAGFLTRAQVQDGLALFHWEVRCSVNDASEDTFILGVQFDYKVRATNS